ncbi:MAG: ArgE/DapE family deacylase [Chloroflexia bacterium]|nr:ArgE/DapE family deacylase [Chloroflexia bacterium]
MRDSRVQREIARFEAAIEARRDELVAIVADLVQRPSPLGAEAAAQAYVAAHLDQSDLAVTAWDLDDRILLQPEAGTSGIPFAGRPNVTGRRSGRGGGRSLIFNGHIDVVSPEPVAAWSHDPWGAEIDGDRMYGRGAFDMKSGVAINLFLARLAHDLEISLAGDLIVHSVIEEECTGNGALAASLRDRADAAIVTEPECGGFTHAHLGVIWFSVATSGRSWHAMEAWRGVNAIEKMMPVIEALVELDRQLNQQRHPLWQETEHPINLNIGVISGGDWPSTVPGACQLRCRVSFYPDQTVAEIQAAVERAVREAAAADPWLRVHPPLLSYEAFKSSGSTVSRDEPSVRLLGEHHRRVRGVPMRYLVGTSINDMRFYNFAGTPAGCYGAAGGNGHAADEWLDLTSLVPAAKVLAGFMLDWCGVVD